MAHFVRYEKRWLTYGCNSTTIGWPRKSFQFLFHFPLSTAKNGSLILLVYFASFAQIVMSNVSLTFLKNITELLILQAVLLLTTVSPICWIFFSKCVHEINQHYSIACFGGSFTWQIPNAWYMLWKVVNSCFDLLLFTVFISPSRVSVLNVFASFGLIIIFKFTLPFFNHCYLLLCVFLWFRFRGRRYQEKEKFRNVCFTESLYIYHAIRCWNTRGSCHHKFQ